MAREMIEHVPEVVITKLSWFAVIQCISRLLMFCTFVVKFKSQVIML